MAPHLDRCARNHGCIQTTTQRPRPHTRTNFKFTKISIISVYSCIYICLYYCSYMTMLYHSRCGGIGSYSLRVLRITETVTATLTWCPKNSDDATYTRNRHQQVMGEWERERERRMEWDTRGAKTQERQREGKKEQKKRKRWRWKLGVWSTRHTPTPKGKYIKMQTHRQERRPGKQTTIYTRCSPIYPCVYKRNKKE